MKTKIEIMTDFQKARIPSNNYSFDAAHEALQKRQDSIMEMLMVLSKEISDVNKTVIMWS